MSASTRSLKHENSTEAHIPMKGLSRVSGTEDLCFAVADSE